MRRYEWRGKSPIDYEFRGFRIPDYMCDGLLNYVERGIPPGDFLTAVICNDLFEAIGRADETNTNNLPAYIGWFYNEAPSRCWGSKKLFEEWIEAGGLAGEARESGEL